MKIANVVISIKKSLHVISGVKHPGENTQKKDSWSIVWLNALEGRIWIKRRALIGLWKFSPDLRKHNWASLGECNNDLRCEEQSERDPAPRSPQAPAGRRETVGENCVKMSSKHPDQILTTWQHPEKILTTSSNILQHLDKMPSTWVRQVVCEGGWLLGRATPAEGFSIGTILTKTRLLAKMLMNVTRLVRKQSFMWRALSKCHLNIATKTKWTERIIGTCTHDVLKSDKSI